MTTTHGLMAGATNVVINGTTDVLCGATNVSYMTYDSPQEIHPITGPPLASSISPLSLPPVLIPRSTVPTHLLLCLPTSTASSTATAAPVLEFPSAPFTGCHSSFAIGRLHPPN